MAKSKLQQTMKETGKWHVYVAILVVLFAVLALATYAWFYRTVEDRGTGSSLTSSQWGVYTSNEYEVFQYSDDDKKGIQVEKTDATLNGYDVIFSERNKQRAIILRIPVTGSVITSGESFKVTFTCESTDYWDSDGTVKALISNAVGFKCAYIQTLDQKIAAGTYEGYEDMPDMIYNEALDYLDAGSSSVQTGTFVSGVAESGGVVSYDSASKDDTRVELTVPEGYTAGDDGILYLYVELNYDDALTKAYFDSHQSIMSLAGTDMKLANDLVSIYFTAA